MGLFSRRKYPPFIESYRSQTPLSKKLEEGKFPWVVLDLETTGLNMYKDRILSAAVTLVRGNGFSLKDFNSWYVYQAEVEVNEATKIHGILPSQVEEGIPEKQMLEELLPLLEGAVIVGHHIRFDVNMLNMALKKHFSFSLKNQILDTAVLASKELEAFQQTGYSNQPLPTMEEVCTQLNIPAAERHTAIGDVYTTAQIFLLLRGRLRQRMKRDLFLKDFPLIPIKGKLKVLQASLLGTNQGNDVFSGL